MAKKKYSPAQLQHQKYSGHMFMLKGVKGNMRHYIHKLPTGDCQMNINNAIHNVDTAIRNLNRWNEIEKAKL